MSAVESEPRKKPQSALAAAAKRQRYDRLAPFYDLIDLPFEYRRYRTMRPQLFAGVSGIILDAGVGTGRNLPFYPEGTRVIGIDSSPGMIARAREYRDKLGRDARMDHAMAVEELLHCDGALELDPETGHYPAHFPPVQQAG